ncbi:MAG: hypothetical protein ACXABY_24670 [Candidatus Thorarchaeota archaeon]|jgi:hypothetical protein
MSELEDLLANLEADIREGLSKLAEELLDKYKDDIVKVALARLFK